jgi:hypothetical protein
LLGCGGGDRGDCSEGGINVFEDFFDVHGVSLGNSGQFSIVLKRFQLVLKCSEKGLGVIWVTFDPKKKCGGRVILGSMKVGFVEVPKMLVGMVSGGCYWVVWLFLYVPVFQKCQDDWNGLSAFVYAGLEGFRLQCSNVPEQ